MRPVFGDRMLHKALARSAAVMSARPVAFLRAGIATHTASTVEAVEPSPDWQEVALVEWFGFRHSRCRCTSAPPFFTKRCWQARSQDAHGTVRGTVTTLLVCGTGCDRNFVCSAARQRGRTQEASDCVFVCLSADGAQVIAAPYYH